MQGTIHVIPQSHIDVAWLWRYDPETIHRCCKPTFTLATDNMDKYPDYTFSQSQVPLYQAIEEVYPTLFEKMRKYIKEGRWEIVGGMYVEFEGGEPCGESIVRQCVMGKRYFLEKFGVDVKTCWQEDAWSHPWQLPQILKKCGMDFYMFKRGEKGQSLFWWQSPDGSRVLTCKPLHGNPSPSWKEFFYNWRERYGVKDVMVRIGRGDHGGGPTPAEIEDVKKFAREVAPEIEVKFDTFNNFMKALLSQPLSIPVINDELGFELAGDLTNCGEIKKNNRECENLLLTTERFCSIARILFSAPYPSEELYESWKKVLFNQFHDIIGGSGIPPVCKDALRFYEIVKESGLRLLQDSLSTIMRDINTEGEGIPVVVFNPLPWERTDIAEVEVQLIGEQRELQLVDYNGSQIPFQIVDSRKDEGRQSLRLIFVAKDVPSLGYKTFWIKTSSRKVSHPNTLSAARTKLSNEFFDVEVDPDTGCIKSIIDKESEKEVLSGLGNLLVAIEDEGDSEGRFVKGSDIITRPPGKVWEIISEPLIEVSEEGPVRAKIRIKKKFKVSSFIQEIILYSNIKRIDFNLKIDWHDVHWMIKVAFPLNVENPEVTYDTAYGSIVRPADGQEVSVQKWVDLSSDHFGVSLLNNGRYGCDVERNRVRMSILRSPTEPAYNTDEGIHEIGYSIYPHSGSWRETGVTKRGYEFNYPLIAVVGDNHPGSLPPNLSFIKVEPENVILEVLKKAYDSEEFVLRLYEVHGKSCVANISMPCYISSAYETDLLENIIGEVEFEGMVLKVRVGAHEIKTLKFMPAL